MHQLLGGGITNTADLVAEEAEAQTKAKPVSCRPSRHGANPQTGRITWIISFLAPVRPFRLFNASERSNLIQRKVLLTRHDLGCQGYCNPVRCTRRALCGTCSVPVDEHNGPAGENCTQKAKCANCYGPFPAGHEHCPAAPRRKDGKIVRLARPQLKAVRRHGERNFQAANPPLNPPGTEPQDPQPTPQVPGTATERPKRKRGAVITAYEDACSQPDRVPDSQPTTSMRPRRSTALSKSLNLAELSARSLRASPLGDMEIDSYDSSSTLC